MALLLLRSPHSMKRYVFFGAIAGVFSGTIAAVFNLSLPLVGTTAGLIAALVAGTGLRTKVPSTQGHRRKRTVHRRR
jgi:hypothetical protein